MARFADEAELKQFLCALNSEYAQYASSMWKKGIRTAHHIANARELILLSCGLPALYIDDVKARAVRTGELSAVYTVGCLLQVASSPPIMQLHLAIDIECLITPSTVTTVAMTLILPLTLYPTVLGIT